MYPDSNRVFAEIMGKLLFWCGEDKIVYGSEAPLFHPQWALEALRRKDAGAADRGFGVDWQNVSWELTALD